MSEQKKSTALTTKELDQTAATVAASGIDLSMLDMSDAETIQTGGVTKWVDLRAFQEDPSLPQGVPVKGNGKAFAGALLSCQEIEVEEDESGEVKSNGTKVRYHYLLRLVTECPVTYKDSEQELIEEIALPGEIVAIGERYNLRSLRDLCNDGGLYVIVIRPHSRRKISPKNTMWTFDLVKKTVRAPVKMQIIQPKAPF